MSFLNLITGGLLFRGGRAEQMTADCSGLSFSERNAAIKKARELDEMMKSATIKELFKARQEVAGRLNGGAPPHIQAWAQQMLEITDQEIVLRSEYELGPQRRQIMDASIKGMNPQARQQALLWTKQKRHLVYGLDPNIDKELAEDERVLGGAPS